MAYIQNGLTLGELQRAMEEADRIKPRRSKKRMDIIVDCLNGNVTSTEYRFSLRKRKKR